jgi:hypothetical protein
MATVPSPTLAVPGRRRYAPAHVPLSKITAPCRNEWVIRRPRIEERIAASPLTVVRRREDHGRRVMARRDARHGRVGHA